MGPALSPARVRMELTCRTWAGVAKNCSVCGEGGEPIQLGSEVLRVQVRETHGRVSSVQVGACVANCIYTIVIETPLQLANQNTCPSWPGWLE